jgi:lyso-ornithine lipid O-acyltransferase
MAAIPTQLRGSLLPRVLAGPVTVSRLGRRLTRASLFTAGVVAQLRADRAAVEHDARRRGRLASWVAENLCALHGIQVVVHGRPPREASIVVANHLSYIDPLAILSHVPATVIAKSEVREWPVIGEAVQGLGALFVDRDCAHSGARVLRAAQGWLRGGGSVVAFPEGTTTVGDRVLRFRRGLFGIAQIEGVPVVPVALRYESEAPCWVGDAAFFPHYVRTTARVCTRVFMRFGAPIDPRTADSPERLAEAARDGVRSMLALR